MNKDIKGFPVITICGSMRYYDRMLLVANQLTKDGWIVLMPFVMDTHDFKMNVELKEKLDRMHLAKIDMSRAIVVVTTAPGVDPGHIGESTEREIKYAKENDVEVYYWTRHFGMMH